VAAARDKTVTIYDNRSARIQPHEHSKSRLGPCPSGGGVVPGRFTFEAVGSFMLKDVLGLGKRLQSGTQAKDLLRILSLFKFLILSIVF